MDGTSYTSHLVRWVSRQIAHRVDYGPLISNRHVRRQSGIVDVDKYESYQTPRRSEKLLWRLAKVTVVSLWIEKKNNKKKLGMWIACVTKDNTCERTVGTKSVRTPERTLWETAVFARRKSGQIFIRFEWKFFCRFSRVPETILIFFRILK